MKMSEEIGEEVKLILIMPSLGVKSGFFFILIGVLQIMFMPILRKCSRLIVRPKNLKIVEMQEMRTSQKEKRDISPLVKKKIPHIRSKTLIL